MPIAALQWPLLSFSIIFTLPGHIISNLQSILKTRSMYLDLALETSFIIVNFVFVTFLLYFVFTYYANIPTYLPADEPVQAMQRE